MGAPSHAAVIITRSAQGGDDRNARTTAVAAREQRAREVSAR